MPFGAWKSHAKRVIRRNALWAIRPFVRARDHLAIQRAIAEGAYDPDPDPYCHFAEHERPDAPHRAIPKVLHQTWKNEQLPPYFERNQRIAREMHPAPGWRYEFWNDDRVERFVVERFPHYLEAYRALPKTIMRVDTFRYMLLLDRGGVYLDLDFRFLKPIDPLLEDCALLLPAETDQVDSKNFIAQHFLASCPGHVFWEDCLREVLDRPLDEVRAYAGPLDTTGPEMVTRVWRRAPERYAAKVPKRVALAPPVAYRSHQEKLPVACYGVHECTGTWR